MTSTSAKPVVVALPAEIDVTNSGAVHADLAAACVPGIGVLVVDMSDTVFCDSSSVRVLVRAHRLAESMGIEFRLVVITKPVLRILELTGLTTVLRLYPSIDAAVGGAESAAGAAGTAGAAGASE